MKNLSHIPQSRTPFIPPRNYLKEDSILFDNEDEVHLPEMRLVELENCEVFDDGSAFSGFKLHEDSLRLPSEMKKHYRLDKLIKRRLTFKKIQGETYKVYLNINDYWSGEYYHFLVEALQRLAFAAEGKVEFCVVLSGLRHKKPYIEESLKLFGAKEILYLPEKSILRAPRLLLPSFAGPPDWHRETLIKNIHGRLTSDLPPVKPFRKIFLSREKAPKRHLINRGQIWGFLESLGYEKVIAEDLSFYDQRKIFNEASHLVTIHGAGLTNTLFMQQGSKVFEIRKDHYGPLEDKDRPSLYQNTYWHICNYLNVDYYYLKAQADRPELYYRECNLALNLDLLKEYKIELTT